MGFQRCINGNNCFSECMQTQSPGVPFSERCGICTQGLGEVGPLGRATPRRPHIAEKVWGQGAFPTAFGTCCEGTVRKGFQ